MFTKVKTTSIKAFSILLALVMCFTALSVCMPVVADAITMGSYLYGRYYYYPQGTQFISSIRYGQAEKSADATSAATQGGYTKLDVDFNSGVSGKDYIFLGYQTSSDINAAMATHFRNGHGNGGTDTYQFMVNGKACDFTITGLNTSGKKDLNSDAGGDYIYLYATKDPKAGLPVTAIAASSSGNAGSQAPAGYYTVEKNDNGAISDCNAGAGGDYVYIYFDNTSAYTDVTNSMLRMLEDIDIANGLGNASCYTTESWNTFKAALDAANKIKTAYSNAYNAGTVPASDINTAAQNLEKAISGLDAIIKIDANGGTTTENSYIVNDVADATTINFPASKFTATKEGHTFLGWNTDKNATSGSVKNLTVPVGATVYAIFSTNKYTVQFYNTATKETIKTESVNYNENATAPDVSPIIQNNEETHYVFKGWDTTFTNIKEAKTVNTIYETVSHNLELSYSADPSCSANGTKVYTCKDCGYKRTETLNKDPENHKNTVSYPQKDSTCYTQGYTAYVYCNDCKKVISGRDPLPLANHTWGEWSNSTATCTEDGKTTRKCSVCNATETKTAPATGHNWSDWETTKEATCTANGKKQRQCSACKETEIEIINALGHNYVGVVTDPTCTQQGYTTYTCSRCGDYYLDTYVNALDHDWKNIGDPIKEATCTEDGEQNQKCSRCQITRVATIEKLGHDWQNETITKEPSCTENGSMSATCARCNLQKDDVVLKALGHSFGDGVITITPTCTKKGNELFTCTTCGYEENREVKALGHDWDEGIVITVATCTQEGKVYHECNRCDTSRTEIKEKLPHNYKGVVTFPTCTEGGYTTYNCADCGTVLFDDFVDALGHATITTIVPPTCTLQGYTVTRCLLCDMIERTDYVPATGHIEEETIIAPTCTQQGYTLVKCPTCSISSKKDYTDALGHEYTDSTVAPTCTQKGYDLHSCIRGDHTIKDNYTDALGHNHIEKDRQDPTKTHSGYVLYICDVCNNEKKEVLYYNGKALIYETLYDTNGNPVTEATVEIYSMTTGKYYTIKTDLNGYFTEVLEEGDYEIVIKKIGYIDTKGYIHINNNKAYVEIPAIPVIDESVCDCYCHKSDFFSAIRRIFAKLLKIFGSAHDCCEYSEV